MTAGQRTLVCYVTAALMTFVEWLSNRSQILMCNRRLTARMPKPNRCSRLPAVAMSRAGRHTVDLFA